MSAMNHPRIAIALTLALAIPLESNCLARQAKNPHAVQINRIEDVITGWNQDQHLYVKGDLGVSLPQLDQLESWLDENAPHWTVVLMHHANDEFYAAMDARKFYGMDAVEFALAHGLNNRTKFGQLMHPKTGEASGSVFVLSLVEREFSYFSSDVHDRRGLGESHWIGELDREVIRAMRNGGRIIDAVKNSVSLIEGRLEKKIGAEEAGAKRAKERIKLERVREIENLKSLIAETETTMLKRVEDSARAVRTKYKDASESELANPPLEKWRTQLANLRKDAEDPVVTGAANLRLSQEFRDAKLSADKVRGKIDRFLDSYAAHQAFDEMMYPVAARLDGIADHPSGVAAQTSIEAYRLLDEARRGHARGELDFAQSIQQAGDLIQQGEQLVQIEQQRLKKEAERGQLIRKTLSIAASVLAAAFLGLLWIFNIRRRPALRRAHALFEKRRKAVGNELEQVDQIIARAGEIIGTRELFGDRKFEGQTMLLGNTIHRQVNNLQKISTEAQRAISSCYELLHPSNPIAEATNMFSGARYEHCVNDLNAESLQVPGRVDENGQSGEPVWMTFDELFSDLHDRKNATTLNLDLFETSLSQVHSRVDELQFRIQEATELEKKLSRAARLDRLFKVPAMFDKLLPAVQSDCDRAALIAASDPVQATSVEIPLGLRKISDGLSLARSIEKARDEVFPKLEDSADEHKKLQVNHRWIGDRVRQLSERAEHLFSEATERGVSDEAVQFEADFVGLGLRARRCVKLAREITNDIAPALEELETRVSDSRSQIAKALGIDASRVLHEDQYDPDVELEQAQKQLQSARAALDYGGVESAMESLEMLEIESNQAAGLVETSLGSLQAFEPSYAEQNQTLDALTEKLPIHLSAIERIKSSYADSAMTMRDESFVGGAWDELEPDDDSPTVTRVIAACDELLRNSRNIITSSHSKHFEGKILQAANSLELIKEDLEIVAEMFRELDEHCQKIEQLAAENGEALKIRDQRLASFASELEDDRTQRPTAGQYSDLRDALQGFGVAFANANVGRDPFTDAISLSSFKSRIDDIENAFKSDRRAFEEASRAVGGAGGELAAANRLVARSINDQIPDSQTIMKYQDEVTTLEVGLESIKKRLQVPHENWKMVDLDATQVNSKLGVVNGRLRRELDLAQQAVQALTRAAENVYEASNWRGSYNIVVVGRPGSDELQTARGLLAEGNYARSIEFSKAALSLSQNAIEKGKQQVERERRKIARKAAEVRRRREASSSSFNFGSSSLGSRSRSSSSFGSSSSRSSSFSRSSSRSGSGFSRSKW